MAPHRSRHLNESHLYDPPVHTGRASKTFCKVNCLVAINNLRKVLVPRRGLEPPRLAALLPESSASTNSAIWASRNGCGAMS